MKSIALGLVGLLPLSLLACGATKIELRTDRFEITAGGIDFAQITATVFKLGELAPGGTKVSFDTTSGSFDAQAEVQEIETSTAGVGRAIVKLYSAARPGSATVNATFEDDNTGERATATITIKFGTPRGESLPVHGTQKLSCDAINIGALRVPTPDIHVVCTLAAQTRTGQSIPTGALEPELMTEAGSLSMSTDDYTGKSVLVYRPKGGGGTPLDVPPDDNLTEPSYGDASGLTRNPRDGLVTIVAVIDGQEQFTDLNGNGEADFEDPFVDSVEPFLDKNDNGVRDAGERFIDANGNGKWDEGNGQYDAETKIMAVYKILWTGKLDTYSSEGSNFTSQIKIVAGGSVNIADGGQLGLVAFPMDANLNPVAAFAENGDALEWTLNASADAGSNDETDPPLSNHYGFTFNRSGDTELKRWAIASDSFRLPSFGFNVVDMRTGDERPPTTYTVNAGVSATPGRDADGAFLDQVTETIKQTVTGLAN